MTKLNAKGSLRLATADAPVAVAAWYPPAMPVCLPKHMHGQYLQVCRNLYSEGLWHPDRLPLVTSYLTSAHVVEMLTQALKQDGVTAPDGKVSPSVKALASAVATLAKAGACLGLTVVRSQPIMADEAPTEAATSKWAKAAG